MSKIVYHGSNQANIEELKAHKSTHKLSCIYATPNRTVALLHMGRGNGDLDTRVYHIDGKIELVERRKGILKKLYDRAGYLYELDGSTFKHYDYLWHLEVISFEKTIKPLTKTYYKNILNSLYIESKKGNIIIYEYPNRPQDMPLDNSDLIDKFITFEKNGLKGAIDDLLKVYPEFTTIVEEKLKNNYL